MHQQILQKKRGIIKIIKSCRKKRNYQKRGISVQTKPDQIEIEATAWPSLVTNRKRARFIEISEQSYRGTSESQRLDEMLVNTNDKSRLDGVSIFLCKCGPFGQTPRLAAVKKTMHVTPSVLHSKQTTKSCHEHDVM